MQSMYSERVEMVENDSPEKLILELYDLGIQNCLNKNKEVTKKIITELINALNFEYTEMAASFYDLYQYALSMLEIDNFEEATLILKGLRSAWEKLVPESSDSLNY